MVSTHRSVCCSQCNEFSFLVLALSTSVTSISYSFVSFFRGLAFLTGVYAAYSLQNRFGSFVSIFGLSAILKIRTFQHAHYLRLAAGSAWNREKRMSVALGKEFDMECESCKCEATLKRVAISRRNRSHIVEGHYFPTDDNADKKRSLFNSDIPPQFFFNEVVKALRSGIQGSKGKHHRFIYFYTFNFKVGTFPTAQGDVRETDTVKIVSTTVQCPICRLPSPKLVVTIYPVKRPRPH